MIKIRYLLECEYHLPKIAKLWLDTIGTKWLPDVSKSSIETSLRKQLHDNYLPLAYIALDQETPIGMCSLLSNDLPSRPKLFPWLGMLCVDDQYRKRGVGKLLMQVVQNKAKEMGFKKIYLFTYDANLVGWYDSLGWQEVEKTDFQGLPVTVMSLDL